MIDPVEFERLAKDLGDKEHAFNRAQEVVADARCGLSVARDEVEAAAQAFRSYVNAHSLHFLPNVKPEVSYPELG